MIINQELQTGQLKLRYYGYEVNQAVQNIYDDVALIQGKSSLLRVYLNPIDQQTPLFVRGKLEYATSSGDVISLKSLNKLDLNRLHGESIDVLRNELVGSLNFLIPKTHTIDTSQDLFQLQLRLILTVNGSNIDPQEIVLDFERSHLLKIRVCRMRYLDGFDDEFYPGKTAVERVKHFVDNSFPVSDIKWFSNVIDAVPDFQPPLSDQRQTWPDLVWQNKINFLHAQLMALRTKDLDWNSYCPSIRDLLSNTRYIGLVENPSGEFYGAVSDIRDPINPNDVIAAPSDYEDGYYAAHEIAHAFGMLHPGFCGQNREDKTYPFENGMISNSSHFRFLENLCGDLKKFNDHSIIEKVIKISSNLGHLDQNLKVRIKQTKAIIYGLKELNSSAVDWNDYKLLLSNDCDDEKLSCYYDKLYEISNRLLEKINGIQHKKARNLLCKFKECLDANQFDVVESILCVIRFIIESFIILIHLELKYGSEHIGFSAPSPFSGVRLYPYKDNYDLMTYCENPWISSYSYDKLKFHLNAESPETLNNSCTNICMIGVCNIAETTGHIKYLFPTKRMSNKPFAYSEKCANTEKYVKVRLPLQGPHSYRDTYILMRRHHGNEEHADLHTESRSFQLIFELTEYPIDFKRPIELHVNDQMVDIYQVKTQRSNQALCLYPKFSIIRQSLDEDYRNYFFSPDTSDNPDFPVSVQIRLPFSRADNYIGYLGTWFTAGVFIPDDKDLLIDVEDKLIPVEAANLILAYIDNQDIDKNDSTYILFKDIKMLINKYRHEVANIEKILNEDWFFGQLRILVVDYVDDKLIEYISFQGWIYENPFRQGDIRILEQRFPDPNELVTCDSEQLSKIDSETNSILSVSAQCNSFKRPRPIQFPV